MSDTKFETEATISTDCGWSREHSWITELLIFGGSSKPATAMEDLALLLLYAPRYLEDETKIDIPPWSAASQDRSRFGQLRKLPLPMSKGLCDAAQMAYDFLRSRPQRAQSERPHNWALSERYWRIGWIQAAAMATKDAGIAVAGSPGPLRFAPFWIRLGDTNESLPAYALHWHRGSTIDLQFVFQRDGVYSRLSFSEDYEEDKVDWLQTYDVQSRAIFFDPPSRADTVLSAAFGAADPATKQPAGIRFIRDALPADQSMPNDLIHIVVDFLTIPPISPAAISWLASQRPVC